MKIFLAFIYSSLCLADTYVGSGTDTYLSQFENARDIAIKIMSPFKNIPKTKEWDKEVSREQFSNWKMALANAKFIPSEEELRDKDGDGEKKAALAKNDKQEILISRPYLRKNTVSLMQAISLVIHESGHLAIRNHFSHRELTQIGLYFARIGLRNPKKYDLITLLHVDRSSGSSEEGSLKTKVKHGLKVVIGKTFEFRLPREAGDHTNFIFQDGILHRNLKFVDYFRPFCHLVRITSPGAPRRELYSFEKGDELYFEGDWPHYYRGTHPIAETKDLPEGLRFYFNRLQLSTKSGNSWFVLECGMVKKVVEKRFLSENQFYHAVGTYFQIDPKPKHKKLK